MSNKDRNAERSTSANMNTGQILQEFIPIDVGLALAKEKLLLEHYFGIPDCSANEFIDAGLDSVLSVQLLDENLTTKQAQELVNKYLSNYVNWAYYAQLHSVKSQYQENFQTISKIDTSTIII